MIDIKTTSGFEISVSEDKLNNMELVDAFAEMNDDPTAISRASTLLLGVEDKKRLYNFLRNNSGVVPADAFMREFAEIMDALGAKGKN